MHQSEDRSPRDVQQTNQQSTSNQKQPKNQIFQSRPQDALVGSTKPSEATEKLRRLIAAMEWWAGGLLLICGDEDGDIDGVEDAEGFADADDYDDDSCEDLEQQRWGECADVQRKEKAALLQRTFLWF